MKTQISKTNYKLDGLVLTDAAGKVKANQSKGIIDFILTSKTVDRDSEVILPDGAILDNFAKNPRLLWSHNKTIPSVGRVVIEQRKVNKSVFESPVQFDVDNDPFSEMLYKKYLDRFLDAGSIGFMARELGEPILDGQRGATIKVWELLEFSLVNIPANAEALRREYKQAKAGNLKKFELPYYEEIRRFYEKQVETGAIENATALYMSELYHKCGVDHTCTDIFDSETQEDFNNGAKDSYSPPDTDDADADADVDEAPEADSEKTMLSMFIGDPVGSFEWLRNELEKQLADHLIEHNSVAGYRENMDYATIGVLYPPKKMRGGKEKSAIVCVFGCDRDFQDDYCLQMSYAVDKSGGVSWQGAPAKIEIALDIRERALKDAGIDKQVVGIVTEAYQPDIEDARQRVEKWAKHNANGDEKRFIELVARAHTGDGKHLLCDVVDFGVKRGEPENGKLCHIWRLTAKAMLSYQKTGASESDYDLLAGIYERFGKVAPDKKLIVKEVTPETPAPIENDENADTPPAPETPEAGQAATPEADDPTTPENPENPENPETDEVDEIMAELESIYASVDPYLPPVVESDEAETPDADTAIAEHLQAAIAAGELKPEDLTPEVIAGIIEEVEKANKQ